MSLTALKDPYRRQGTAYLHVRDNRSADEARLENPTGAVVIPISLATTFEQKTPGLATSVGDPNSFGKGYEYSRTGKKLEDHPAPHQQYCVCILIVVDLTRFSSTCFQR